MSTEREHRSDQSERAPHVDPFERQEARADERSMHASGDLGASGRSHSYPERRDGGTATELARPEGGSVGTADLVRPASSSPGAGVDERDASMPLLAAEESSRFQERWQSCQQSFVDEPRDAVKRADELVAEMMQKVAGRFAATRDSLEKKWAKGDEVDTEDLRLALQQYRAFFNRLLAV